MTTFQTDADTGRGYAAKGFNVVFSGETATVECYLDTPMLIEPIVVLREIEGFRICKCSHDPKVWVIPPGRDFGGGWAENIDAAVESIDKRLKETARNRKRIAGEKTVVRRVVLQHLFVTLDASPDPSDEPVDEKNEEKRRARDRTRGSAQNGGPVYGLKLG